MSINYGVQWARAVAANGWPRKESPAVERIEAYEELAAAYHTLAAQAATEGDMDRYLSCADLAEHADRLARELRGPEHVW